MQYFTSFHTRHILHSPEGIDIASKTTYIFKESFLNVSSNKREKQSSLIQSQNRISLTLIRDLDKGRSAELQFNEMWSHEHIGEEIVRLRVKSRHYS